MLILDPFQAQNCSAPPKSPRRNKLLRSLCGDACKSKKHLKKVLNLWGKNYFLEGGGGNDFKTKYTPLLSIKEKYIIFFVHKADNTSITRSLMFINCALRFVLNNIKFNNISNIWKISIIKLIMSLDTKPDLINNMHVFRRKDRYIYYLFLNWLFR